MNPGLYFFTVSIIMLFIAGAILRSGFIDTLMDMVVSMGNTERIRAFLLLIVFYIFSPLFLGIPLISVLIKRKDIFERRDISLTFFTFSAIFGSIILPFGSLRGMYLADYYYYVKPDFIPSILLFPAFFFMPWIVMLVVQAVSIPFLFKNKSYEIGEIRIRKFRWQELVFSGIVFLFIIMYYARKMYFAGLVLLSGIFIFSFVGKDTLKKIDWWLLLFSIPAIPIFLFTKTHPIHLKKVIDFVVPYISSPFITANLSAYIFTEPLMRFKYIFIGITAGASVPLLGGYEFIYLYFIKKEKISWLLSGIFSGIFLLVSVLWGLYSKF